jgi:hypothetical protein
MQYRINIAKREQIRMRYGKMEDSYRHYFKIETDLFGDALLQLISEQKQMYPAPEWNVTLYRETSYSELIDLDEKETA